jgi:hypothetical protein
MEMKLTRFRRGCLGKEEKEHPHSIAAIKSGHVGEGVALDALGGQFSKPTLDRVEPTATGGHEVNHPPRHRVDAVPLTRARTSSWSVLYLLAIPKQRRPPGRAVVDR